ncbi:hypothetical protein ACE38W_00655 [Chitinophaga sp. Hz27]|uniref:hypothetical protein n=1 Tax=Chitinophaga sp. Hz27 TaxID=3347169 RepID=UPI0035DF5CC7
MYAKVTNVIPRKSKQEKLQERAAAKEELAKVIEHGDVMEIYNQMNILAEKDRSLKRISYWTVYHTLKIDSSTWSPRVIEYARLYTAEKLKRNEERASQE